MSENRFNSTELTGWQSLGQVGNLVRGYMTLNQVIASSRCLPPSAEVTLIKSLGVWVGKRHHLQKKNSNWFKKLSFQRLRICSNITIPFMTSYQCVPCTGTKRVYVNTSTWSGWTHYKPPIRRSSIFTSIFK